MALAIRLKFDMPSIGFLSGDKRIECFLSVCRHLDQITKSEEVELDSILLALLILQFASKDFAKAYQLFMHRAPRMSYTDALQLPKMAFQLYRDVSGN